MKKILSWIVVGFVSVQTYAGTQWIYQDTLENGWENASWNAAFNMSNSTPIYAGSKSIVTTTDAWGAFSIYREAAVDIQTYGVLEFYIQGSAAEQVIQLYVEGGAGGSSTVIVSDYAEGGVIPTNTWALVQIPFLTIPNMPNPFNRISFWNGSGSTAPTY